AAVGVSTQVAPVNRSSSAPSSPTCSDPAIGWPPTNRGWGTAATTGPFTPATSVTTRSGRRFGSASSRLATAPTAPAGVATTASSASASSPTASTTPAARAARTRSASASSPVTCQPRARSARATDPPIRPAPTTRARRPPLVGPPLAGPPSAGKVIAEALGAVQVDVPKLLAFPVGVHVQQHPEAVRHGPRHRDLEGAQQRDRPEPDAAGGGGREHRHHVGGGGEHDADDVVLHQPVGVHDLGQQLLDPLGDLLGGVVVDGGGAPERSYGHRPCMLPVPADGGGEQRPDLVGGEGPPRPRLQRPVGHRADPAPHQPPHRMADGLAHPPDLPVPALVDDDADHPGGHHPDHRRGRQPVVQLHPLPQPPEGPRRRHPLDLRQVLLVHPVRRVGEQLGQLPVVGHHQQPLRGPVQPAHREHPGLVRHQRHHRRPTLGVRRRRHHPRRLVQQVVHQPRGGGHRDAVDGDPLVRRVHPAAQLGHLAVHRHPAVGHQVLADPPATQAGPGQHLLQPLPGDLRLGRPVGWGPGRPFGPRTTRRRRPRVATRPPAPPPLRPPAGSPPPAAAVPAGPGRAVPGTGRWCRTAPVAPGPPPAPPPRCTPVAPAAGPPRRRSPRGAPPSATATPAAGRPRSPASPGRPSTAGATRRGWRTAPRTPPGPGGSGTAPPRRSGPARTPDLPPGTPPPGHRRSPPPGPPAPPAAPPAASAPPAPPPPSAPPRPPGPAPRPSPRSGQPSYSSEVISAPASAGSPVVGPSAIQLTSRSPNTSPCP